MTNSDSLSSHLIELRRRLLRIVLFVLLVLIGLFTISNELYEWVAAPLIASLPEHSQMIATEVAAPFLAPFKLALATAFIASIPYILFETWCFIAPGLFKHEKRLFLPILLLSVLLFYTGVAFAFYVVFPVIFNFFSQAGPQSILYTPDISRFLDTALKLLIAFGIAFEVPVATLLMILSGATNAKALAKKRPFIIVACFIIGMLLTPPDPVSQALMAIPMWLLFEVGILFGYLLKRKKPITND